MDDQNREYEDYEALHDELFALLDQHRMKALSQKLGEMNEFDISEFLGELWEDNPQRMAMVFRILSKEIAAAVFANLEVEEQETIINSITDTELAGIIEELYVDDAVDMMEELPANVVKRVMRTATPATRNLINQYLKYPENSAGSIMTAEFVDLKKYMSVREAFARIRKIGEDKETIYVCYVTSAKRKLEGVVTVKDLLLSDDDVILEDIMDTNVIYASTTDDQEEVSEMISNYDLIAIPVVDKEGCLVGIVTVDDIIDVMEQETTEDIEKMAGITPSDKPYSRTSVVDIWKNRIPWLMFLMLSATFTGMIVTHFEDALATQVALASFMPMLMGTGGNSGSQSSTAIIRSLSLGDTSPSDALRVIWKELRVAFLCGVSLAAANFIKMLLVDRLLLGNIAVTMPVAATVCCTIVFVVMFAKVVGSLLPMIAEKIGVDPKNMRVISVMPCTSKKAEAELPTMRDACGDLDVDVVITTRELVRMLRCSMIDPSTLEESSFDSPLGSGTGAAVIFGATGGVMDAALRSAYYLVTGKNPDPDAFSSVRGMQGWKEASFDIPGAGTVRTAVVSGLGNTRKLLEALQSGSVQYDFVEIMACPGGCAGGGGQPIHDGIECAEARGNVLWRLDHKMPLRFSHENPDVQALYKEYLGKPLSERSHHLLHTDIDGWQMPQNLG